MTSSEEPTDSAAPATEVPSMPPSSWPLPFGPHPELELHAQAGAISLIPVREGEAPHLEATGALLGNLAVQVTRDGERVRVQLGSADANPFTLWQHGPNVRVTLHVPPGITARIHSEVGRIRAEDLEGCDLELRSSAGTMALERCRGRILLHTAAGKIEGDELAGTFDVETGAGAVRLGITHLAPGRHRVRSSVGSVNVDLALGLAVQVETRTTMGSAVSRYPSVPDAPAVLEVSTELGSVRVRPRGIATDAQGEATSGAPRGYPPRSRRDRMGRDWTDPSTWAQWFGRGFVDGPGGFQPPWVHGPGRPGSPPPPHAPPPPPYSAAPPYPPAPPPFSAAPPPPPPSPIEDEELRRILSLLEEGKISAAEAEKLLRAMERRAP